MPSTATPGSRSDIGAGHTNTWSQDKPVSHPICDNFQTRPDPAKRDHHACDGCGVVVDTITASPAFHAGFQGTFVPAWLTRFRVELVHLEGSLQLCARCSPGDPAMYWTRDLEKHIASD